MFGYIYWPSGSIGQDDLFLEIFWTTFLISDLVAQHGYIKPKSLNDFINTS